jgi:hypothetical protein
MRPALTAANRSRAAIPDPMKSAAPEAQKNMVGMTIQIRPHALLFVASRIK